MLGIVMKNMCYFVYFKTIVVVKFCFVEWTDISLIHIHTYVSIQKYALLLRAKSVNLHNCDAPL